MTMENVGFNIAASWKAEQHMSADRPVGYCYVWPHRAEPPSLSGCVVAPPSATMWGGPGAFSEATVEMEPLSGCKVRHSAGSMSAVSLFLHTVVKIHGIFPCLFKNYIILQGIIVFTVVLR